MALHYKISCGDLVTWRLCTNDDMHYTFPATW